MNFKYVFFKIKMVNYWHMYYMSIRTILMHFFKKELVQKLSLQRSEKMVTYKKKNLSKLIMNICAIFKNIIILI